MLSPTLVRLSGGMKICCETQMKKWGGCGVCIRPPQPCHLTSQSVSQCCQVCASYLQLTTTFSWKKQDFNMVHLPPELLSHVCSFLAITPCPPEKWNNYIRRRKAVFLSAKDEINLKTMLEISVASSSLHDAVQPHLYRTITPPTRVTQSLLRTLILVPSTARQVQNLSTPAWTYGREHPTNFERDSILYTLIAGAIHSKGVPAPLITDILRGVHQKSQEALYAVLLLLCTNLRVWTTTFGYSFRNSLVSRMVLYAYTSNSALQHLRELNLFRDDEGSALPFSELYNILGLPNLRIIRGYHVDLRGFSSDDSEDSMSLTHPNLREITLEQSFVGSHHSIESLLCAYGRLEILSLDDNGPPPEWEPQFSDPVDDYSVIGDALRQHGIYLRSLRLLRHELDDDDTINREPLGSLVALTSLQRLTLSYDALYGGEQMSNKRPVTWLQEILPPSLESLEIDHVVHTEPVRLDEQVRALICDQRFSNLDFVRIHRAHEDFQNEDAPDGWEVTDSRWCFELSKTGSMRQKIAEIDEETAESEEETAETDQEDAESDEEIAGSDEEIAESDEEGGSISIYW